MEGTENSSIDIFLPFFGDVAYFKKTVESVISQDSNSWQLTIVNDAHPDYSVDRWVVGLDHPRIRYIRNESNLGLSQNLLRCFEFSNSKHCVFLGCDDLLLPTFVSSVSKQLLQNPDVMLIQPRVRVVDEFDVRQLPIVDRVKLILRRVGGIGIVGRKRVAASLLIGNWMYFPSIVWRADLVKKFGFDANLDVCQDLDLILKILDTPGQVVVMKDELFLYRRHSESISSVKLLTGERFVEEKRLHYKLARKYLRNSQFLLGVLAVTHFTSRLHALVLIPKSLGSMRSFLACVKHLVT